MSINFFDVDCQSKTNQPKFGLCDAPSPSNDPAYIDTTDASKWIAIVENTNEIDVTFTAIDNCIKIRRADGTMDHRCDGMLTYQSHIVFVELKERNYTNSVWINDADQQIRNTIMVFVTNHDLANYKLKKAYIANSKKPNFQYAHKERMQRFRNETSFMLIIHNIIKI
jgi:hypothetical protein